MRTYNLRKNTAVLSLFAALTTAITLSSALTASATSIDDFDPLEIVQEQNLIGEPDTRDALAPPYAHADSAVQEVEIVPVADAAARGEEGSSVIEEESFGFVTTTGTTGTNASFVVLKDESAPGSYDFEIGDPTTALALQDDGSVLVYDGSGEVVNFIAAPWATDAVGVDLHTYYSVEANVLTQHIDTTGAMFPVTADPTMGCGVGWCSVYFNRKETAAIAAGGPAVGAAVTAACAKVGVVIAIGCGVSLGIALSLAGVANRDRNCVGILFTPLGSSVFIEPRGTKHCK